MKIKIFNRFCAIALSIIMTVSFITVIPLTSSVSADVVAYSQYDWRWGDWMYGGGNIADSGCGILSSVNAINYMCGGGVDPESLIDRIATYAHNRGAFNPGDSADGTYRTALYPYLADEFGEEFNFTGGEEFWSWSSYRGVLKEALARDGVAVAHVWGHFICIADYDPSDNTFLILDSAPSWSRGTYYDGVAWLSEADLTGNYDAMIVDYFALFFPTDSGGKYTEPHYINDWSAQILNGESRKGLSFGYTTRYMSLSDDCTEQSHSIYGKIAMNNYDDAGFYLQFDWANELDLSHLYYDYDEVYLEFDLWTDDHCIMSGSDDTRVQLANDDNWDSDADWQFDTTALNYTNITTGTNQQNGGWGHYCLKLLTDDYDGSSINSMRIFSIYYSSSTPFIWPADSEIDWRIDNVCVAGKIKNYYESEDSYLLNSCDRIGGWYSDYSTKLEGSENNEYVKGRVYFNNYDHAGFFVGCEWDDPIDVSDLFNNYNNVYLEFDLWTDDHCIMSGSNDTRVQLSDNREWIGANNWSFDVSTMRKENITVGTDQQNGGFQHFKLKLNKTSFDGNGITSFRIFSIYYDAETPFVWPADSNILFRLNDLRLTGDNQEQGDEAEAVEDKINAIGTVTLESASAITDARNAYNALSDEQKSMVSNYSTLVAAEQTLELLQQAADKKKGDINDDNKIDAVDALLALQASSGRIKLSPLQRLVGDVNGDGTINTTDALILLQTGVRGIG